MQFTNACKEMGLVGEARTWNMLLFRLRKAGRLADVATTERSPQDRITWSDCDPFLYASEIAWKLILDEELATSLDEILCDPLLTQRFDAIAREFAPGFTAFQYRWGALKLRKESKDARVRAASLSPPSKLGKPIPFDELALDQTPAVAGVYLLGDPNSQRAKLYLGETINLQGRLHQLFSDDRRELWCRHAHDAGITPDSLSVWVRPIEADACEMLAWQTCLVQQYKPYLNLLNG